MTSAIGGRIRFARIWLEDDRPEEESVEADVLRDVAERCASDENSTARGVNGKGASGGSGGMTVASGGEMERSLRFVRTLGASMLVVLGSNGGEYCVAASTIRLAGV